MAANQVYLLNVRIDDLTTAELLAKLKEEGGTVVTPNVDLLGKLQSQPDFFAACTRATYCVCDSQILMYAARWLGTPLAEKISGSDLLPAFCEFYRDDPEMRVFLLGAGPGVADEARAQLNAAAGREIVVGTHSPPFGFERDPARTQEAIACIRASGANVLFVGLGSPKQELWIDAHREEIPEIRAILAVGAAIDFAAGSKARSPQWMSAAGLEWLYRLSSEPRRLWRRYLLESLPVFWLLLQQKLGRYRPPEWAIAAQDARW